MIERLPQMTKHIWFITENILNCQVKSFMNIAKFITVITSTEPLHGHDIQWLKALPGLGAIQYSPPGSHGNIASHCQASLCWDWPYSLLVTSQAPGPVSHLTTVVLTQRSYLCSLCLSKNYNLYIKITTERSKEDSYITVINIKDAHKYKTMKKEMSCTFRNVRVGWIIMTLTFLGMVMQ